MIAVVFALAGIGAGSWSLDNAFSFDLHSTVWGDRALVAGVLGGVGTVLSADSPGDTSHTPRPSPART